MGINLKIESDEIESDFERIANDLLNNWILHCEGSKYRITELEFYYQNDFHEDS